MINIYCDESCHLEYDDSNVMVLGAISCPEGVKNEIYDYIRQIKIEYGFSSWFEVKWTKITEKKVAFYKEIVEYFFSRDDIKYRGVVATGKKNLNHTRYNSGSYDEWYYKMYYCLLNPIIKYGDEYRVFIDIKDTRGGVKVNKLHEIICNDKYDWQHHILKDIKQIRSHESELLEVVDLLNGALAFYHRGLYESRNVNEGKRELVRYLIEDKNVQMDKKTALSEKKFNILIWQPRG